MIDAGTGTGERVHAPDQFTAGPFDGILCLSKGATAITKALWVHCNSGSRAGYKMLIEPIQPLISKGVLQEKFKLGNITLIKSKVWYSSYEHSLIIGSKQ